MTSCENFLKGGQVAKEIEEAIAYNNAKEITVLIQSDAGKGTTLPSGNYTAKKGYDFEISFSEAQGYSFIEWIAVDKNDESKIISEGITFADAKAPKTKVKITNDKTAVKILPKCSDRIAVSGDPSPRYEALGVSRDRPIIVEFTKELDPASFIFTQDEIPEAEEIETKTDAAGNIWAYTLDNQTYFKNIEITNADGYSIAQHFKQPSVNGKYLTIEVDKTKPIAFETGVTLKTVVVTLNQAITDKEGVQMSLQKSWRYQITEATDDKATINFVSTPAQGTINAISKAYSIGQTVALSFTENAGYQFVKWDYNPNIVSLTDATSADTTVIVLEKTTETNPTQIKAICAERLRVTDFSPKTENAGSTVSKNTSITITFNKELPNTDADKEQLKNILISIGGTSVKSSFKNPVINANTITFAADNSNMIEVFADQTKTVSVSIPADFYYVNDGTKVIYGGNGYSYDYKIDSSTSQKTDITFTTSKQGAGLFTAASGTNEYSIGQEIPIAFEPTTGWKFTGWTITSAGNPVPQDKIRIEDSDSTSTKITILQEVKGVTITANAYFVPVIESIKINGTDDYRTKNSFPCDSTVHITFNKPMDTQTVNLSRYGSLTITKNETNGPHFEDYFTLEWNDDKTKLILKPTLDTETSILTIKEDLVPEDDDTYSFLLTFNANLESIKDTDGQNLEAGVQTYNSLAIEYKITGEQEQKSPTVLFSGLYSTSNSSDDFYRSLTTTPYNSWSRSEKTIYGKKYYFGDYSRNHVSHIYIELEGYDEGSGVKELRVKETFKRNIDGNTVTETSATTTYAKEQYATIIQLDDEDDEWRNNTIYQFKVDYNFNSENTVQDGLFLIQVSLVDNANNEQSINDYWVIKDTNRESRIDITAPLETRDYLWFGFFDLKGDLFYKINNSTSCYSHRLFTFKVHQDGDETDTVIFNKHDIGITMDNKTLINEALSNYTRDPKKTTWITIELLEESGLTFEFPVVVPKSIDVLGIRNGRILFSDSDFTIDNYSISYRAYYTFQETAAAEPGNYTVVNNGEYLNIVVPNSAANGIYTIYMVMECDDGKSKTWSTIGKPIKYYKGVTDPYANTISTFPTITLPKYADGEIQYEENTGMASFSIGLNYSEEVDTNYNYYVCMGNYSFKDPSNIKVKTRNNYKVYLIAVDNAGNIVGRTAETNDIVLSLYDETNAPPKFIRSMYANSKMSQFYIDSNALRCWYIPRNANDYTDSNPVYITKADYYFVPYSVPQLTYEELSNSNKYKKHEITLTQTDISNGYISYNYDDLDNGRYRFYVYCYDCYGNTSFGGETLFDAVRYYVANYRPSLTPQDTGIKITSNSFASYMCPANTVSADSFVNDVSIRYLDAENELWKDSSIIHEAMTKEDGRNVWNYNLPYSTINNCFIKVCGLFSSGSVSEYLNYVPIFMMPVYAYTGYYEYLAQWEADASHAGLSAPAYCRNKTWIPVQNGWQIFADRPCFVHTLYCSKDLGGINNWLAKGQETGLVYHEGSTSNSTFSYTNDNFDDIPENYYYITICHFADGSTVASDVKQKEE